MISSGVVRGDAGGEEGATPPQATLAKRGGILREGTEHQMKLLAKKDVVQNSVN